MDYHRAVSAGAEPFCLVFPVSIPGRSHLLPLEGAEARSSLGMRPMALSEVVEQADRPCFAVLSEDEDLLAIAHRWMENARPFTGLIRTREPKRLIGQTIEDLLIVAYCYSPQEIENQVVFVPL